MTDRSMHSVAGVPLDLMDARYPEIRLGDNLEKARRVINGVPLLILDGREKDNPANWPCVKAGVYVITRTDGTAPGEVAYYGYLLP